MNMTAGPYLRPRLEFCLAGVTPMSLIVPAICAHTHSCCQFYDDDGRGLLVSHVLEPLDREGGESAWAGRLPKPVMGGGGKAVDMTLEST